MNQPNDQLPIGSVLVADPAEQFDAIRGRRRETAVRVSETRREAVYKANHREYKSALIQADSLIAEARRLRQRIELEKLAHERLQDASD